MFLLILWDVLELNVLKDKANFYWPALFSGQPTAWVTVSQPKRASSGRYSEVMLSTAVSTRLSPDSLSHHGCWLMFDFPLQIVVGLLLIIMCFSKGLSNVSLLVLVREWRMIVFLLKYLLHSDIHTIKRPQAITQCPVCVIKGSLIVFKRNWCYFLARASKSSTSWISSLLQKG